MEVILEVVGKDSGDSHYLMINGRDDRAIYSLSESPEDAIVGRNLVDGYDIIKYIQMGYNAAKNGETLDIKYEY